MSTEAEKHPSAPENVPDECDLETRMLSAERQLAAKSAQLVQVQDALARSRESEQQLRADLRVRGSDNKDLLRQVGDLKTQTAFYEEQHTNDVAEYRKLREDFTAINLEIARQGREIQVMSREIQERNKNYALLERQLQQLQTKQANPARITPVQLVLYSDEQRVQEQRRTIHSLDTDVRGLTGRIEVLTKRLTGEKQCATQYFADIRNLRRAVGEHESTISNLQTEIKDYQQLLREAYESVRTLDARLVELLKANSHVERYQRRIGELQGENRELRVQSASLVATQGSLQAQLSAYETEILTLLDKVSVLEHQLKRAQRTGETLSPVAVETSALIAGVARRQREGANGVLSGIVGDAVRECNSDAWTTLLATYDRLFPDGISVEQSRGLYARHEYVITGDNWTTLHELGIVTSDVDDIKDRLCALADEASLEAKIYLAAKERLQSRVALAQCFPERETEPIEGLKRQLELVEEKLSVQKEQADSALPLLDELSVRDQEYAHRVDVPERLTAALVGCLVSEAGSDCYVVTVLIPVCAPDTNHPVCKEVAQCAAYALRHRGSRIEPAVLDGYVAFKIAYDKRTYTEQHVMTSAEHIPADISRAVQDADIGRLGISIQFELFGGKENG